MIRTANVSACLAAMGEAPTTSKLTVLRARLNISLKAHEGIVAAHTKLTHLSEGHPIILSLRAAQASLQVEINALEGTVAELEQA